MISTTGIHWEAVAKVAEAEKHKLDALTAYQTAIAVRLKGSPVPDELNKSMQRLWKELGGTDQGWRAFMARVALTQKSNSTHVSGWIC